MDDSDIIEYNIYTQKLTPEDPKQQPQVSTVSIKARKPIFRVPQLLQPVILGFLVAAETEKVAWKKWQRFTYPTNPILTFHKKQGPGLEEYTRIATLDGCLVEIHAGKESAILRNEAVWPRSWNFTSESVVLQTGKMPIHTHTHTHQSCN